jgi:hypothetical protein
MNFKKEKRKKKRTMKFPKEATESMMPLIQNDFGLFSATPASTYRSYLYLALCYFVTLLTIFLLLKIFL